MLTRITARLRSFRRASEGIAAVEFALIAPVMILLYFGMVELCQAMMADRRASHATSAIGDLVGQSKQLYAADYADIFSAATTIMAPFATTTLNLRVTSVTAGAAPAMTPTVDWSEVPSGQTGMTPLAKGTTVILPAGTIVNPGDNLLMAEATYTYTSPVGDFLKTPLTFTPKFYLKPRSGQTVIDCNQSPTPSGC